MGRIETTHVRVAVFQPGIVRFSTAHKTPLIRSIVSYHAGNIRLSIAALQVIEGARVDMSAKLISHPREPTAGQAIEIAGLFLSGVVDYSPCLLPRGQMALERNCIPEAIIQ